MGAVEEVEEHTPLAAAAGHRVLVGLDSPGEAVEAVRGIQYKLCFVAVPPYVLVLGKTDSIRAWPSPHLISNCLSATLMYCSTHHRLNNH